MKSSKPDYEQLALAFLDLFEGIKVHELPRTGLTEDRCDEIAEIKFAVLSDDKIRKHWTKIDKEAEVGV